MSKLVHRVRSNVLVIFYFYLVVQYSASLLRLLQAPIGGKYRLWLCGLSTPQRSLCVVGRQGRRKKESTRGTMGGGGEKAFSPSHRSPSLSSFRLLVFSLGYPAGVSTAERVVCCGYFGKAVKKIIHYNQYTWANCSQFVLLWVFTFTSVLEAHVRNF